MPKYLIEREIPGAGSLSADELHQIAAKSNAVFAQLGGRAHWIQSYVTDDNIFCVYTADTEDAVREHARMGGFPCNVVREVSTVIDTVTGEG